MGTAIDEALELLRDTGPEFGPGYSNHGPMAAEAMITLNRSEKVKPWVERYKRRLHEHPQPGDPISQQSWQQALGKSDRVADWIVFFRNQLRNESWQSVLGQWVPELAPGMMAAGTHGLIRTAHAARTLSTGESELRLNELAEGLGYWAALFGRLPGMRKRASGHLRPAQAIEHVPIVPKEALAKYHLIQDSMAALEVVDFAGVVNLVEVRGEPSRFISELTETTAACYLANATDIMHAIAFIHTVTAPSMLRVLVPYISSEHVEDVLSYAWQAVVGLYAVSGQNGKLAGCAEFESDGEDLVDRAIGTNDEHAIKFTAACLREYELNPKPIYLAAASHASRLIAKEPVSPAIARC